MIQTNVQVTDNDPGIFKRLKEFFSKGSAAFVSIGVHEDAGAYTAGADPPTVVEVALWNEFGTEKIPERSFLRSAIDENESQINKWREEALVQVLDGKWTLEKALESIGFKVQQLIQNKIKSNVPPPNADSTIKGKRREGLAPNTLIESGLLLRSITYKVHVD